MKCANSSQIFSASLLLLLSLFTSRLLGAEHSSYIVEHFGSGDGLPQNSVNAITQTDDGYLWLGTFNGLVRYDGVEFRVFDSRNSDTYSVNRIGALDSLGRSVVVAGFQQVVSFNSDQLQVELASASIPGDNVRAIRSDGEGSVWILRSQSGIVHYSGDSLAVVDLPPQVLAEDLMTIQLDNEGNLWSATARELIEFNNGEWLSRSLPNTNSVSGLQHFFWNEKDNTPIVVIERSMYQLTADGWILLTERTDDLLSQASTLVVDEKRRIWLGTRGSGLFVMDVSLSKAQFELVPGLLSNTVISLYRDRENSIWAGTVNSGVHQIRDRLVFPYAIDGATSNDISTSLIEDVDGSILFGSRGGGLFRIFEDQVRPAGHEEKSITSLFRDSQDRVWMGTLSGEIWRRDQFAGAWQPHTLTLDGADKRVFSIFEDSSGNFWIAVPEGVILLDEEGQHLIDQDGGLAPYVRAIIEDREGALWFGTQDSGLFRLADGEYTRFTDQDGLASNGTWHLHEDSDGVLWAGSFGEGLSRIQGNNISAYTSRQGLRDNVIAAIHSDQDGRLWLGSARGLFFLQRDALTDAGELGNTQTRVISTAVGEAAGAGHEEITGGYQQNVLSDQAGHLWFTTQTGVMRIDLDKFSEEHRAPTVLIQNLMADEQRIARGDGEFHIQAGTENLNFEFTAPGFIGADQIAFKYRLEGYDSEWIEAGTLRTARYSHVPPGSYTFRVLSSNGRGAFGIVDENVDVFIAAYFWQTALFQYVLIIVLIMMLAAFMYWLNRRRFKRRLTALEQRQALDNERVRIARDLHDELGSGLTHLHLLCDIGSNTSNDQLSEKLSAINAKSRELVGSIDEIVWSVDPRRDNLESLLNYIVNYSETFLASANIRCLLDTLPLIPDLPVPSRHRHQILSCVKEILNNIVKYAECDRVVIHFEVMTPNYSLEIADNGKGFSGERAAGGGNGLKNLQERMASMGGTCQINSDQSQGTRVQLEWEQ